MRERTLTKLKAAVTMANTHKAGLRLQIITDDAHPFKHILNFWGVGRNIKDYLAVVIDPAMPESRENALECCNEIMLTAKELGLTGFMVRHTFDENKSKVYKRPGEKLIRVIALLNND